MQLILLVDSLLLDAVPAFLLSNAQGAGDVISKIQPLFFSQVICCKLKHSSGLQIKCFYFNMSEM